MYLVGEALIGDGAELAHIDLLMGDKEGPVGSAFANSISQLSMGHTPLLAVVRPNLLTKPATIVIPKVTLKDMTQVNEMFGPVQAAVAKAVADCVEEEAFKGLDIESVVIMVSAFVHPDAKDYNKIYRYNYGATKLAIHRALDKFPDAKTLVYEKDRAAHGIMGFKVTRLWDPAVPAGRDGSCGHGQGRPGLKGSPAERPRDHRGGNTAHQEVRPRCHRRDKEAQPNAFIIADMKILDTGNLEARMAADATADAVVVSGLAPTSTIEKAIAEARKVGIYSIIDMLNVQNPAKLDRESK